jgi:hypothetical protein
LALAALALWMGQDPGKPDRPEKVASPVYPDYDPESGFAVLKIREFGLREARSFSFVGLWQFDVDEGRWVKIAHLMLPVSVTVEPKRRKVYSRKTDPEWIRPPEKPGLYWY